MLKIKVFKLTNLKKINKKSFKLLIRLIFNHCFFLKILYLIFLTI